MKLMRFSLFFILISTFGLLAQSSDIQVKVNPISDSRVDWEIELSVILPISPSQGFVLEIPEEIVPIPVRVRINEKELWLRNIGSVPARDSVVAWQTVDTGVMFLFKNRLLKSGDRLVIKFITSVLKTPTVNNKIVLKEIVSRDDGLKVANRAFASGAIPSLSNR